MEQVADGFRAAASWLGVPPEITPWELLNSELITAMIIGIFGLLLGRKVNRLTEKAEDNAAAAAYEREVADLDVAEESAIRDLQAIEPSAGRSVGASPEAYSAPARAPLDDTAEADEERADEDAAVGNPLQAEASYVVNAAKKLIDERLASQKDGRKLRKYDNIGKRDYGVRALAARDDGLITEIQALNLLAIFEMWRPYGTGRKIVTEEVIRKMKSHMREAEREKTVARAGRRRGSRQSEGT